MLVGIFGAGRNGSTLLMRLLDGARGLWVYPVELNYLSNFEARSWRGWTKRAAGPLLNARRHRNFDRWAAAHIEELHRIYLDRLEEPLVPVGDALALMAARRKSSLAGDLETFLGALQESYDDRGGRGARVVFKSIDVPYLARYRRLFPSMKFVHIVRHPYSNYSSLKRTDMVLKKKPFWFQGGDILRLQIEDRWIPHARFMLRGVAQEPSRHFIVRYEDLCADPDQTIAGICRWLDADPPADSREQTVLGGRRMKELPGNTSKEGVATPTRVIKDTARAFGYDDVVTDRERELIRIRTFDLARRLGYFTEDDPAGLPNRLVLLRQWMMPDRWEYMNASSGPRLARAIIRRRLYLCRRLLLPS